MNDTEIERLVQLAVAEMQGISLDAHEREGVVVSNDDELERAEDERYFSDVAIPLGEAEAHAGLLGSDLIVQDREP